MDADLDNTIDGLLDAVDASRDAAVSERRRVVTETLSELERLRATTGANMPRLHYATGYVLYAHPDRLEQQSIYRAVEHQFAQVLAARPRDPMSWLYLGHNAYDKGDYQLALSRFQAVDLVSLPRHLQLRDQEMVSCCHIRILGLGGALLQLEKFVREVEASVSEDVWPVELARCIQESQIPDGLQPRLLGLLRRLDAAGHWGDWFAALL